MLLALAALLVVAVVTAGLWWLERSRGGVQVSASSSEGGTGPQDLLDADVSGPAPAGGRPAVWRSAAPAVGAWLQLDWAGPTRVDRVRLAAASPATGPRAALLVFDGGASLLVHAGADGDVDIAFPAREVSSVRVTVAEAATDGAAVELAGLRLDDSGSGHGKPAPLSSRDAVAITTSSGDGGAALQDGAPATGDAGAAWKAAADDSQPWVQLSWGVPRVVSSVQVLGAATSVPDPDQPAAAQLAGLLRFDDGSSVVVSGIEGGQSQPTTVAFSPRVASEVRLELTRVSAEAQLALREVDVQGEGTTPPRWPAAGQGLAARAQAALARAAGSQAAGPQAAEPVEQDCSAGASVPVPEVSTEHPVVLVCPPVGAAISGETPLVVAATPGASVTASAAGVDDAGRQGVVARVAAATADADGRAVLLLPADDLPSGPVGVLVDAVGAAGVSSQLRVPLVNTGGRALAPVSTAPKGMTLQWSDDFDTALSATTDGDGAVYAARKPTATGGQSFGDAGFGDPGAASEPLLTTAGTLRMRADDGSASGGASAALLSSLRVGAGGFAAQYGYFEARMLGGPGTGSWPAFWALNTQSATADSVQAGEADAVELYGHNPVGSCHSTHDYSAAGDAGTFTCLPDNGTGDWTLAWHTYGMRVAPDAVTFFIDGVQVAEQSHLGRSQEPFFFLLDQALGGGWPVDLSPTSGLTDTYVDWVRVYT